MKPFTAFLTALFILVGCSSKKRGESKASSSTLDYVEEIAKNVQTDKRGTWYVTILDLHLMVRNV